MTTVKLLRFGNSRKLHGNAATRCKATGCLLPATRLVSVVPGILSSKKSEISSVYLRGEEVTTFCCDIHYEQAHAADEFMALFPKDAWK